jgi:hypothetical protein
LIRPEVKGIRDALINILPHTKVTISAPQPK